MILWKWFCGYLPLQTARCRWNSFFIKYCTINSEKNSCMKKVDKMCHHWKGIKEACESTLSFSEDARRLFSSPSPAFFETALVKHSRKLPEYILFDRYFFGDRSFSGLSYWDLFSIRITCLLWDSSCETLSLGGRVPSLWLILFIGTDLSKASLIETFFDFNEKNFFPITFFETALVKHSCKLPE